MTANARFVVPLLVLLAACGSSPATANLAQAASLQRAALQANGTVSSYRTAASAATTTEECAAALQRYESDLQAAMQSMRDLAPVMDGYMQAHGMGAAGDLSCDATLMASEMARHHDAACSGADAQARWAEAQQHCDAMQTFADHAAMRAVEAGGMMQGAGPMGGGMMGGGAMMGGSPDTAWMSGWTASGWMMPDGQLMPYAHALSGCGSTGG